MPVRLFRVAAIIALLVLSGCSHEELRSAKIVLYVDGGHDYTIVEDDRGRRYRFAGQLGSVGDEFVLDARANRWRSFRNEI